MNEPNSCMTDQKRLIMVIEKDAVFNGKLHTMLSEEYQVEVFHDTESSLAFLRANAPLITLVMLDLRIAGSGGMAFLKTLKSDPSLRQVPVIVLTKEKAYEVECLQEGASDFIRLPSQTPDVIRARVRRAIESSGQAARSTDSDELTGINNQETFFRCAAAYDRLHPDAVTDAVCIDISGFHIVNDLYSRGEGNRILVAMANELQRIAAAENGIAGRKAADVFLLYLPHRDTYTDLLQTLQDALGGMTDDNNAVRLKMGVYPCADKQLDVQTRFDRAKLARDTIHYSFSQIIAYYDGEKYRKDLLSRQLMQEMDAALTSHSFKVYYQPKFDVTGDRPVPVSAEALVRWHHPEMGVIFPGMFVPLFEDNGLITKLDRYVWEETAAQIRRWRDRYGITFPVSVNASRMDMADADLTDYLLGVVRKNDIEPKDLYIEITESAYTKNFEQLVEQVGRLRAAGFKIEMDDFGSGYSSLNMLSSIIIDVLKLDISFIRNMFGSERNLLMLQLMMQIKDSLHVPVVAEGVETEEQLRHLKEIGCEFVQGYYFSQPVPPEQFDPFLEELIGY